MRIIQLIALAVMFLGCSNPSDTPPPGGNASPSEVAECKEACNQLKFFECNDSVDHARCFAACDSADSSGIEVFAACVGNDICDASCSVSLNPPATPPPSGGGCVDSCGAFLAEGCAPGIDVSACAEVCREEPAVVAYCLGRRSGCDLPAECASQVSEPDPAEECREGCQQLGFFDCITPLDASDCSSRCGSADEDTIARFSACASTGICSDDSCYRILNPEGASADVAGCRSACDDLSFFDCIDSTTLSQCRSVCAEASADAVESFKSCAQGICDDDSCYLVLLTAD